MTTLYERIVEQTQKMDITGKELGNLLGLKKSPLTDWKNGKSNPTLEQFCKMCEIFAISPEWLLTGKESGELTAEEQQLIDNWRRTADPGRKTVQDVSNAMANTYPRQETSSSSKIG